MNSGSINCPDTRRSMAATNNDDIGNKEMEDEIQRKKSSITEDIKKGITFFVNYFILFYSSQLSN